MFRMTPIVSLMLIVQVAVAQESAKSTIESPLSEAQIAELTTSAQKSLDDSTQIINKSLESVNGYSKRGDALFFLGRFKDAVADYDKMNELDAGQSSSNWRRGIALFYAKKYEDAAAQFESYHSFDQVDRENGIWRYLSQRRAFGLEKAREGLLKYQKDDREPFPAVYKLFAGTIKPDQIIADIAKADLSKSARDSRLFYAHLYIGLNYAVENETEKAQQHLAIATRNSWPASAGYGPNYMWHVGRLHEELLRKKADK